MKSIYLAGPFFNETQIRHIEAAEQALQKKGLPFFSPMRHTVDAEEGTSEWAYGLFALDRTALEQSDIVVALYDGNTSDSGTAWECGYAFALGKPVVLVHTDKNADSNLMLHCSAATNITLEELVGYDFDAMPAYEFEGKMF